MENFTQSPVGRVSVADSRSMVSSVMSEEERRTAVRSAEVLGLNVAGVDLLRSNRGPVVVEVN